MAMANIMLSQIKDAFNKGQTWTNYCGELGTENQHKRTKDIASEGLGICASPGNPPNLVKSSLTYILQQSALRQESNISNCKIEFIILPAMQPLEATQSLGSC